MLSFIGRRILIAIPTILLISVFVFFMQKLLPGDPVLALAGEDRNPEILEFLREKYRLNDPLYVQYFTWIGNALTGDLGVSLRTQQPVLTLIAQKLPVTIQLAIMALIIAVLIGVPAGILSAYRKGTWVDWLANILALSGLSVPNFWLGIMLILLVSVKLGWLPASGYQPFLDDPLQSIRTMLMRDGDWWAQAGAGIVADSDPAFEYEETLHKLGALTRAIVVAEKGLDQ